MLQSMSGELYGEYIVIDCVFVYVFNRAWSVFLMSVVPAVGEVFTSNPLVVQVRAYSTR